MSRIKDSASNRGRTVNLPNWWIEAVKRRCGDSSAAQIAEQLSIAVRRQPPFHQTTISDFLAGRVTTDAVMGAFLMLFPDLPPPVFWASSYEEAHRLHQVSRGYPKMEADKVPRVEETIEDTADLENSQDDRQDRSKERNK
jgi:hypothetical protein